MTPNEMIGADQQDVSQFHIFGSISYVAIQADQRPAGTKHLGARAVKMYYLGPDSDSRADRFWDPVKKIVLVSAHARHTDQVETIDSKEIYLDDQADSSEMIEKYLSSLNRLTSKPSTVMSSSSGNQL